MAENTWASGWETAELRISRLAALKAKCGKPKPCFGPCWSGDTLSVWMYLRWKLKTKKLVFGQNNCVLISQHSWFRFWKVFFSLLQLWATISILYQVVWTIALELSQFGMFKLDCRESPWAKEKVSSWRRELEQQRTQRSIQMSLAWGIFVKCDWYLRCI